MSVDAGACSGGQLSGQLRPVGVLANLVGDGVDEKVESAGLAGGAAEDVVSRFGQRTLEMREPHRILGGSGEAGPAPFCIQPGAATKAAPAP